MSNDMDGKVEEEDFEFKITPKTKTINKHQHHSASIHRSSQLNTIHFTRCCTEDDDASNQQTTSVW